MHEKFQLYTLISNGDRADWWQWAQHCVLLPAAAASTSALPFLAFDGLVLEGEGVRSCLGKMTF